MKEFEKLFFTFILEGSLAETCFKAFPIVNMP